MRRAGQGAQERSEATIEAKQTQRHSLPAGATRGHPSARASHQKTTEDSETRVHLIWEYQIKEETTHSWSALWGRHSPVTSPAPCLAHDHCVSRQAEPAPGSQEPLPAGPSARPPHSPPPWRSCFPRGPQEAAAICTTESRAPGGPGLCCHMATSAPTQDGQFLSETFPRRPAEKVSDQGPDSWLRTPDHIEWEHGRPRDAACSQSEHPRRWPRQDRRSTGRDGPLTLPCWELAL